MKAAVVIIVLALLNLLVAHRFKAPFLGTKIPVWPITLIFSLFFLLQLVAPVFEILLRDANPIKDMPFYPLLIQISYFALGIFSCLLFYTLVIDIIILLVKAVFDVSVDHVLYQLALVLVILTTGMNIFFAMQETKRTSVYMTEIRIKNLPESFENLAIAQISDLHVGSFVNAAFVKNVVAQINKLEPDIVVITGDIADGLPQDKKSDLAPLKDLKALGKLYVTGNHEYYWDAQGWIEAVKSLGFVPLINENKILKKGGADVTIAGVTDLTSLSIRTTEPTNLNKALKDAPVGAPIILLSHQPALYDEAKNKGVSLMLSGHTHGGQYFPFSLFVRMIQPFITGLHKIGDMQLYISKGTGFWGPPLRTGGPGEITLIKLKRG